ncbi:homocysteine S-methyltransferase family protein [Pseudooctadecabacter jejudonensis]|uniref:Homocysteine S-methyltransferase n=1 Tax=Pseudooctadecabacter jejudonensis TaxID=1391910 RepID=A0A1Y5SEG4_9RHOB|nr:homocysteine S-methyltransferase family protein [Pseudooctadecabacter jejudonensis]SLN35837.1 Homocysteine S-methyltransferase [Pseudooctadecabacter jejudonensis]
MTQITLLDGGMGQELVHRAGDNPTPLWSTQVMLDHPGLVAQVHRDFAAAGATVATTNTYAIHHDRLEGTPVADRFADLHATALKEIAQVEGRKAGSIGPLVQSYRADIAPPYDEAVPKYAEIAQLLAPSVDMIICETVASVAHARAVFDGAKTAGIPVWVAFTVSDTDGTVLRSGEPLAEGVAAVAGADAVLVNCSAPEVIIDALPSLAAAGLPYGAYANGFEQITEDFLGHKPTVNALNARRDFTPAVYADHAMAWVDAGATIVGGCCEVGPAHIAEIANRLRAAGHTII